MSYCDICKCDYRLTEEVEIILMKNRNKSVTRELCEHCLKGMNLK